jgi:ribosomal protein S18 acetylase RimI-like enzyme
MIGDRSLRRADLADLESLTALQQAAYARNRELLGVEPIPLQWDYREVLAGREVWLLEAAGALAGALVVTPRGDHLYVDSIAVDPSLASRGHGNALLSVAESRARALGLAELRLITGEVLASNVAWYRRKGFEIVEIEEAPDRRIVHMRRVLG